MNNNTSVKGYADITITKQDGTVIDYGRVNNKYVLPTVGVDGVYKLAYSKGNNFNFNGLYINLYNGVPGSWAKEYTSGITRAGLEASNDGIIDISLNRVSNSYTYTHTTTPMLVDGSFNLITLDTDNVLNISETSTQNAIILDTPITYDVGDILSITYYTKIETDYKVSGSIIYNEYNSVVNYTNNVILEKRNTTLGRNSLSTPFIMTGMKEHDTDPTKLVVYSETVIDTGQSDITLSSLDITGNKGSESESVLTGIGIITTLAITPRIVKSKFDKITFGRTIVYNRSDFIPIGDLM